LEETEAGSAVIFVARYMGVILGYELDFQDTQYYTFIGRERPYLSMAYLFY